MIDFFRVVPHKRVVRLAKRRGVIFNNPGVLGRIVFHLGTGMFMAGIVYGIYLYYPLTQAVFAYWRLPQTKPIDIAVTNATPPVPTQTAAGSVGTTEYTIYVPRINARARIEKDVSPFSQKEYVEVLKDGVVAQAKDSDGVGMGKGESTFIFAHSTEQGLSLIRQNSIFYLLSELKNNDDIFIYDSGKTWWYRVYMQKIVRATDVEYLTYSDQDREVLILQTCWPLGTDWKRLLVFAERV